MQQRLIRIEVSYEFLRQMLQIPQEVGIVFAGPIENRPNIIEMVLTSASFPELANGGVIPKFDCVFLKHETGITYSFRPRAEVVP